MIVETPRGKFGVHFAGGTGRPASSRCTRWPCPAPSGTALATGPPPGWASWGLTPRPRDSPWDDKPFTVEDMADDAAAVIEATAPGPVGVIGLSMGGSTALVLATRRPDLVSRVVLADASACYGPDRIERWAERAHLAEFKPREQQLEFQRDRWFGTAFQEAHPETVSRVCDIFLRTTGAAHAAACRALGGLDATDQLGKITAPALVMVGSEDYATPPAMARAIAAGIPGAELMMLEGARHMSLVERPSAWARIEAHLGA